MNCPEWICQANGVPYDYVYALAVIVLAIPYLVFLVWAYKNVRFMPLAIENISLA